MIEQYLGLAIIKSLMPITTVIMVLMTDLREIIMIVRWCLVVERRFAYEDRLAVVVSGSGGGWRWNTLATMKR